MDTPPDKQAALSFEDLWHDELDEIACSRNERGRPEPVPPRRDQARDRAHDAALVGLALSGGGIRSATFNLGVLQTLARFHLLRRFDYISTVSGGGYIGSWLSAWIKREGIAEVERRLSPGPAATSPAEDEAVRSLRRYSNYLTPRVGLLSLDTWHFVVIYLRNLLLNLVVLVSGVAVVLLVPRVFAWLSIPLAGRPGIALAGAGVLALVAAVCTLLNLRSVSHDRPAELPYPRHACPGMVGWLVVAPLLAAAWLAGTALWGAQSVVWGTSALLLLGWLLGVLVVGVLGRLLHDERREWTARAGAWLLIAALGWTVLFGAALYVPLLLQRLDEAGAALVRYGLGPAWLVSTLGGLLAGRSSATAKQEPNRVLEIVARVAPYIFIAGLLALLSLGIHQVYAHFMTRWPSGSGEEMAWTLAAAAALSAIALFFSRQVDLNEFSMYMFYRNRLVRCYLGASNRKRNPQPFSGFSSGDDEILLATLAPQAHKYSGPYPIISAAVNLTQGEELAWQRRKAASFSFTPRFCGFEVPKDRAATGPCRTTSGLEPEGYRPTVDYAYPGSGVELGSAMAVSGAAASPNMGYHTSTATAFLMTVFNVRLGWWFGNPRHRKAWRRPGPPLGLIYLFGELFGSAGDRCPYVYLSDGGHFENLGLYELVRRRCRFIVACDGSEDHDFTFEGLGNAIEKCRIDFNIRIEIDFEQLRPPRGERHSRWHCAVGKIRYDRADPDAPVGTLLYIKSSLTGDEQGDVKRYASENSDFPHQPTSDQWFDESQFESYRALGFHAAQAVLESAATCQRARPVSTEELFLALRRQWYPPSAAITTAFTRHTASLHRIMETIRTSRELEFLDAQIYPEWERLMDGAVSVPALKMWLPESHAERRAGFYVTGEMIQLMEDVYIDLNLEHEFDHPDNRGWMNLFKHWSWSGMFRVTWAIAASTYGARFQNFCARQLGLDIRKQVRLGSPFDPVGEREKLRRSLNFFEVQLVEQFLRENPGLRADQVHTLEIHLEDPMTAPDSGAFRYHFGFALTGCRTGPEEPSDALLYLRVQDHLRKMGLPREAIERLILDCGIQRTLPGTLSRNDPEAVTMEDGRRFVHLFEAVRYEVQSIARVTARESL